MKTQHFTLSIPEPCSEAWEQMSACGSGKFCENCRKTVIDFTDYSEAQIAAFFADKRGESVCGRFYASQIEGRTFSYVAPAKKPYRTLAMAASVAALTVMSFTAEGQEIKKTEHRLNAPLIHVTQYQPDTSSKTQERQVLTTKQIEAMQHQIIIDGTCVVTPRQSPYSERFPTRNPNVETYTGEEYDRMHKSITELGGKQVIIDGFPETP